MQQATTSACERATAPALVPPEQASPAPLGAAATRAPASRLMLWLVLLGLLGVGVAAELTRIHLFVHTDPSFHSVCAVSEGVNCETVASSPYSVFAGIPVSVWGLAAYGWIGVLGLWGWSRRRLHATWPLGLLLVLSTCSVLTSAILAVVSLTRIDSLCLFCTGSYLINAGLLSVSLVGWRRTRAPAARLVRDDLGALDAHQGWLTALVLAAAATLGALWAFVPPYWQHAGWSDLPTMATGKDEQGHYWLGATSPRLTIVEFSDYECPHCRAAHKALRLLVAKHAEQVRLVHRHLPLDMACHRGLSSPFHTRACLFAEAAECAGLQGHFWEMNDALFSSQETVRTADVDPVELAVELGLDRSELKRCLASHETASRVAFDVSESMAKKLSATPSLLVGERLFVGGISEQELEQLLREAR